MWRSLGDRHLNLTGRDRQPLPDPRVSRNIVCPGQESALRPRTAKEQCSVVRDLVGGSGDLGVTDEGMRPMTRLQRVAMMMQGSLRPALQTVHRAKQLEVGPFAADVASFRRTWPPRTRRPGPSGLTPRRRCGSPPVLCQNSVWGLTCCFTLGVRGDPCCLPVHGPGVRLACAAGAQ
jgi:hypothetical protein